MLAGRVTVQPKERTNLVSVTVTTPKAGVSARGAAKVAVVFIDRDAQRETEGARRAYEDLSKSIEDLGKTISEQEANLISYMRSSGLPLQEKGQDLSAARLQTMSETWLKAMEGRRQLEARYSAAAQASSRGEGMNIPDLSESKIFQDTIRLNTERKAKLQDQIRDIEKKIQDSEVEKAELLVKYTPEYSKVKEVEERIGSLAATKVKTEREVTSIIERDQ